MSEFIQQQRDQPGPRAQAGVTSQLRLDEHSPIQNEFENPLQGHGLASLSERPAVQRQFSMQCALNLSPRVVSQRATSAMLAGRPPVIQRRNSTGMPDRLKEGVENLSGLSMDDVKVHYNSPRPAPLQAKAFTQGTDIHVGPGQENTLGHEAWHVVQQKQGRVRPTLQLKGTPINGDALLEREADEMGSKALQGVFANPIQMLAQNAAPAAVAQFEGETDEASGEETKASAAEELRQAIELLKQLLPASESRKPGESEGSGEEVAEYIAELEEIADGDDDLLKEEAVKALDEAVDEAPGVSGEKAPPEETVGQLKGNTAVVQRSILTWLQGWVTSETASAVTGAVTGAVSSAVSTVVANPLASLAVTATLATAIHTIRTIRNRKKLPARATASARLFTASRQQYWNYFSRYLNTYAATNNVSPGDTQQLKTVSQNAIFSAWSENNFMGPRFSALAAVAPWQDNRFAIANFVDLNIFTPFIRDLGQTVTKTVQNANIQSGDLAGFTKALKRLPFVKDLNSGKAHRVSTGEEKQKRQGAWANWKDGGTLQSNIQEIDDGYSYLTRDDRQVRNGNFAKKVAEADRFVRLLVEPGILATMPRPTIAVHLRNSSGPSLPWGFRAFQSNGVINVAQNEETSIIVHEVGHYIENNLPMERWHEIQMLLHARGGGAQNASYLFYPRNLEEQRFPGEYPATGQYTSKYYASGSTEVTSLSVEYLADPARFQRLIEADPQQAALVLRALRPTEFMMAAQKKTRGTLGWYADRYLPK